MPTRKLLIAYFPRRATRTDLKRAFQHVGKIHTARIVTHADGQNKCYGFLDFYNHQDATLAFNACERGEIQLVDEFSKTWYLRAEYANGKRGKRNRQAAATTAASNSSTDISPSVATDFEIGLADFSLSDFPRNCTDDVRVCGRHTDHISEISEHDSTCTWKSDRISEHVPTDSHMRDINVVAPRAAHIGEKAHLHTLLHEYAFGDFRDKHNYVGNPQQQHRSNGFHHNRATAGVYLDVPLNRHLFSANTRTNVSDGEHIEDLLALRERLDNDIRGSNRREMAIDENAYLQNLYSLTYDDARFLLAYGKRIHRSVIDQEYAPNDNGKKGGLNDLGANQHFRGLNCLESQYGADTTTSRRCRRRDNYFFNRNRGNDGSRCVAENICSCDPCDTSIARSTDLDNFQKRASDNAYCDRYRKFTKGVLNLDAPLSKPIRPDSHGTHRSTDVYPQDLRRMRILENAHTVKHLTKYFSDDLVGDPRSKYVSKDANRDDYCDAYIAKHGHVRDESAVEDIALLDPYSTRAAEDVPSFGPPSDSLLADGDYRSLNVKRGHTGAYCDKMSIPALFGAGDADVVNINGYEDFIGVTVSL